jgi:hypothetical protein
MLMEVKWRPKSNVPCFVCWLLLILIQVFQINLNKCYKGSMFHFLPAALNTKGIMQYLGCVKILLKALQCLGCVRILLKGLQCIGCYIKKCRIHLKRDCEVPENRKWPQKWLNIFSTWLNLKGLINENDDHASCQFDVWVSKFWFTPLLQDTVKLEWNERHPLKSIMDAMNTTDIKGNLKQ